MREWHNRLYNEHQKPKPEYRLLSISFPTNSNQEPGRTTNMPAWVAWHLGLDIESAPNIVYESPEVPKKFDVVPNDVKANKINRLNWLKFINFINLLDYAISELEKFNTLLAQLSSQSDHTIDNITDNTPYQKLLNLRLHDAAKTLIDKINSESDLNELEQLINQFCVSEYTEWPLFKNLISLSQKTSNTDYFPDCEKEQYQREIHSFFVSAFSAYSAALELFNRRRLDLIHPRREAINQKNRGISFPTSEEALKDTFVSNTSINLSKNFTLKENEIKNIDDQINNKISKKTQKSKLEKQLLRVHTHAKHLHRRHHRKKYRSYRLIRFILSLFFISKSGLNSSNLEQQKYLILYQVIKLILEKNSPDCRTEISKIKSDSMLVLNQHRFRWHRARLNSSITTSLRELNQLELLLSEITPRSLD
jgi:hypothetical protein